MTRSWRFPLAVALFAALLALVPCTAWSAWFHDPTVNTEVSSPGGAMIGGPCPLGAVGDGAGGEIVCFLALRTGRMQVYAQRLSATGVRQWTNDVQVGPSATDHQTTTIATDGVGGAIIAWWDLSQTGVTGVHAQRISASGAILWTAGGVPICSNAVGSAAPRLIPDGAGGAIITWQDARTYGTTGNDIYAQRVSSAGAVQWAVNGVAVCTATAEQGSPFLISDGSGGAIIAWDDRRSGSPDIYAQRISAAGAVQWTANGVAISAATNSQSTPVVAEDGAGGAIITWHDLRNGTNIDVYAQRVSAAGVVQWTANGVAICAATGNQTLPVIVPDGAAGAILAWDDKRSGSTPDIYAQRITSAGTVQWAANGVPICTAPNYQTTCAISVDGEGGAILAWQDGRTQTYEVYGQRISSAGAVQWTANGVPISTASGYKQTGTIVISATGSPIITWIDQRNSGTVYAQRVDNYGHLGIVEPFITGVNDIPDDQGGKVRVLWTASSLDSIPGTSISSYTLWRRVTEKSARQALAGGTLPAPDLRAGAPPVAGAIRAIARGTEMVYWEYIAQVPARGADGYACMVPTTTDSMPGLIPYNVFFVDAKLASGASFYVSQPDSGYSVDNLAPCTPASFTGEYAAGTATLHWPVNPAEDLREYRLYRGAMADFEPAPGNLVTAQPDTGYVDAAGGRFYYKLCAADVHGNASSYVVLLPTVAADAAGPALPASMILSPPAPNPARGPRDLAFALPRAARVDLALFDQQGRRVRSLVAADLPAGNHSIRWDGRDQGGRDLTAGLYFLRLSAEGRTLVIRLGVLR